MQRIDGKAYPTVTEDGIYGFFQEYRFLSNFHECSVWMVGATYPTSEHAYMAQKTLNIRTRQKISKLSTPQAAKAFAKTLPLRPDWETVKRDRMYAVLECKFVQNKYLRILLDRTGDKYLEETNWRGDRYWGVCEGEGKNHLGRLLMRLRRELRNEVVAKDSRPASNMVRVPRHHTSDDSVRSSVCA